MPPKRKKSNWERWDSEVKKFKASEIHLPKGPKRSWRRQLLIVFMQEFNKNLLTETYDIILDKIMEALRFCFDLPRVRSYIADNDKKILKLYKTSKNHWPSVSNLELKIIKGADKAVNTLFTKNPIIRNQISKLNIELRDVLKIKGTYAAIPFLVTGKPLGLITADTVESEKHYNRHKLNQEYLEQFNIFCNFITSAIESKMIFDERNNKINQLELIDQFAEIIQRETSREKLLHALIEYSGKLVNATGGHLKIYNHQTRKLERVADYGKDIAPPEIKHKPRGIGFSNTVFQTGKSLLLDDTTQDSLMIKHREYCQQNIKKKGYAEYLKILENRKSALIVPLITHEGKKIGVIDLHSHKLNQFKEHDRNNLLSLVSSVIIAIDKSQQMERLQGIISSRDKYIEILQRAIEKSYSLESVLEIIRNNCLELEIVKGVKNVCLLTKDPITSNLIAPSFKCLRKKQDCELCLENNPIIEKALQCKKIEKNKKSLALPILHRNEAVGVLYIEGENHFVLSEDERELLNIITRTAAILIKTATDYEKKIKQITTIYEAGQLSTKTRDFSEWFHPMMEMVMDVVGRDNRNFHLVLLEEQDGEKQLIVRETSALYIDGKEHPLKKNIFNIILPIDDSVSGLAIKTKTIQIIDDIDQYKKQRKNDPQNFPYFEYDDRIKSEVVIPLSVNTGTDKEKIIGTLAIDSVIKNDFLTLDLRFILTIAHYLAISIYNQQLYEERAQYQEELLRIDRSLTVSTLLHFFYHEFSKPLQEIQSTVNLLNLEISEGKNISKEKIKHIEEMIDEQYTIFHKFTTKYFQPFQELKKIEIRKLINESLTTIEKTSGLDINIKGNYHKSDIEINCYPNTLELAFGALIRNAIKYSKEMDKSVRYLKIDVAYLKNDKIDAVSISFENNTKNQIPPDKFSSIFEPYVRGINKQKGIGLGLAMAKMCLKRHFGDIKAENIGDDAVKFTITIPKI